MRAAVWLCCCAAVLLWAVRAQATDGRAIAREPSKAEAPIMGHGRRATVVWMCAFMCCALHRQALNTQAYLHPRTPHPPGAPSARHRCAACARAKFDDLEALKRAAGSGEGKHQRAEKRKRTNKYEALSNVEGQLDPFQQQEVTSREFGESLERERRKKIKQDSDDDVALQNNESCEGRSFVFPDAADIDPYDPTTFGFTYLGKVVGVHGLKGEVKVEIESDFATSRLYVAGSKSVKTVHTKPPNRRFPKSTVIRSGRPLEDGMYLIRFHKCNTREAARRYLAFQIYTREDDRPEALEDDEYLVGDLVGLRALRAFPSHGSQRADVTDTDATPGEFLGTIIGVVTSDELTGVPGLTHDLLELQLPPIKHDFSRARDNEGASASESESMVAMAGGDFEELEGEDLMMEELEELEELERLDMEEGSGLAFTPTAEAPDDALAFDFNHLTAPQVRTCLIPFVPQIVPEVDLGREIVYIDPPPGLLDLAVVQKKKHRVRALIPEHAESLRGRPEG